MSILKCNKCGEIWYGTRHRDCPRCLAQGWIQSPTVIRPKHDPRYLPSAYPGFRSTLPGDFPERASEYLEAIAYNGTALYSTKHRSYLYVCGVPQHLNAGSAIPSGSAMPTTAMNAYIVAKPFDDPHIYAEHEAQILSDISFDNYSQLPLCSLEDCNNLQMPNSKFCKEHSIPTQPTQNETLR